jgi:hypothetical protein
MRKADGIYASTSAENAEVIKYHCEQNVFNRNEASGFDVTILDEIDLACEPKLGYSVTPAEIQHAIKMMKTEKSPGKNGIPPKAYKVLEGLGEGILENIITTFWDEPD